MRHFVYSRVSNKSVQEQCCLKQLSQTIREMQLKLLGKVLTDPRKQVLREVAFHKDSLDSETSAFVRRVGRPRQNWTEQLIGVMKQAAGTFERWVQAAGCAIVWRDVSARVS